MDQTEAWRLYEASEKRLDRCRSASQPDPTGTRLAEYQVLAAFQRWLAAAGLTSRATRVGACPAPASPIARAAWIAS